MRFGPFALGNEPKEKVLVDLFINKMSEVRSKGVDFEDLARESIREKLGEATEGLIFSGMSDGAKQDPRLFAAALKGLFGFGAVGMLTPIIESANLGRFPKPRTDHVAELESHITSLGPYKGNPVKQAGARHRIYDEKGNLIQEEDSEYG